MIKTRHFPQIDRISLLAAAILLAYMLTSTINLPIIEIRIPFPGIYFPLSFDVTTVIAFFIMGLTGSGVEWLLRGHPNIAGKMTIQHWLLPTLTAWAIGTSLARQPIGPIWWVGFGLGGSFLIIIMIAEYITVDLQDIMYAPAAITLRAVAFVLYLVLLIAMQAQAARLVTLIPTLSIAIGLVSLRVLHLKLFGVWTWIPTLVIMVLIGEIAAALHYLRLSPITFSLIILGTAYAAISLVSNIIEKRPRRQQLVESMAILIITFGIAFLFK